MTHLDGMLHSIVKKCSVRSLIPLSRGDLWKMRYRLSTLGRRDPVSDMRVSRCAKVTSWVNWEKNEVIACIVRVWTHWVRCKNASNGTSNGLVSSPLGGRSGRALDYWVGASKAPVPRLRWRCHSVEMGYMPFFLKRAWDWR